MNKKLIPFLISGIFISSSTFAQSLNEEFMGEVNVKGRRTNQILPEFPSTTSTIDAKEIEDTVNAIDTPDVLKYLPDIMVRKRDSADFNGAPIGSRIWGISYSAKTIVNIDGMPISNQLFNDNTYGSPRWWMTNPDEIKNVEVMYGPYSAAYSGNSEGAVVNFATVMPTKFTAIVNATGSLQQFKLFGTDSNYANSSASAILGDKQGDFAWRLSLNHEDAHSQPRTYAVTTNGSSSPTGYRYVNNTGASSGAYLGATNLVHGISDNANLKMALDLNPDLRATLTSGVWTGQTNAGVQAFNGTTASQVQGFNTATTSSAYTQFQQNYMNGLSLKTIQDGDFTWEMNVSNFYTDKNAQRWSNSLNSDGSMQPNGAGQVANYNGTGWTNADLRGNYKIGGEEGSHKLSFGAHYDYNRLNFTQWQIAAGGGWQTATSSNNPYSISKGATQTQALWIQDLWKMHEDLRLTAGLRYENWSSFNGQIGNVQATNGPIVISNFNSFGYNGNVSPKISLAWDGPGDVLVIGSLAKATRFPTVSELYSSNKCSTTVGGCQAAGQTNAYFTPDPTLIKPENVTSAELSFEKSGDAGNARFSFFTEQVRNALLKQLYAINPAQPTFYYNVWSNVQLVTASGVELAGQANNVLVRGLDIGGNITRVVSRIAQDNGLGTYGQSVVGNPIPYAPPLRFTAVATYRPDQQLAYTIAGRFQKVGAVSMNNDQVNPDTYGGFSTFFVLDAKVRYQIDKNWLASAGIDNVLDRTYWMYHPFPQRTFIATLKYNYN